MNPYLEWPVGSTFKNRAALSAAGIHRPTQAGIGGSSITGAESIVLSGGYEDDKDEGDLIIYTGEGGRDASTGRQIADQKLERGNLALRVSLMLGRPIRVVRRDPTGGYRYDGLFRIEDFWADKGASGFCIFRFRLTQLTNAVLPVVAEAPPQTNTQRRDYLVQRIVRDTQESLAIKKLYDYTCQVCQKRLEPKQTPYAEGAHIRPLGKPHNGPDNRENLLCLCPNDHVLFDYGGVSVDNDFSLLGTKGNLIVHPRHAINPDHLLYHREHYFAIEG